MRPAASVGHLEQVLSGNSGRPSGYPCPRPTVHRRPQRHVSLFSCQPPSIGGYHRSMPPVPPGRARRHALPAPKHKSLPAPDIPCRTITTPTIHLPGPAHTSHMLRALFPENMARRRAWEGGRGCDGLLVSFWSLADVAAKLAAGSSTSACLGQRRSSRLVVMGKSKRWRLVRGERVGYRGSMNKTSVIREWKWNGHPWTSFKLRCDHFEDETSRRASPVSSPPRKLGASSLLAPLEAMPTRHPINTTKW